MVQHTSTESNNIQEAIKWLDLYNNESQIVRPRTQEAAWTWNTNITDHNNRLKVNILLSNDEEVKKNFKNSFPFFKII